MDIKHNIYILDHPTFKTNNISFLSYIKKNQDIIKQMGVKLTITSLTSNQLNDPEIGSFLKSKNIDLFPVLITDQKIYKGMQEIVNIYENNISEYNQHLKNVEIYKQQIQQQQIQQQLMQRQMLMQQQQQQQVQQRTQQLKQQVQQQKQQQQPKNYAPIDSDEQLHSYMSQNLHSKSKNDDDNDDEVPFGDDENNSMMDTYRHMITRRNGEKRNPFNSKMRTVEDNNSVQKNTQKNTQKNSDDVDMQNVIFNQLQSKNNMELRSDNIKEIDNEETVNIDPSKIDYDQDEDPQDKILESAYWNRIAETK